MKTVQERAARRRLGESLITQISVRILVPFIQLYGLYIIAHGHVSPGGGFQGGVVLGASFILLALAFDLKTAMQHFPEGVNAVTGNVGVLLYVGTGVLCALVGGLFLDYAALAALIPLEPARWRYYGAFIVELGVGLAVMAIMFSLYRDLGSAGKMDEGL